MAVQTRAVIYTRISRDDSGEGQANTRQEADCRTLANLRNWTVVDVVPDVAVSAYSGKSRPGWQRVTQMMRDGQVDIVVAWHMDRITRTVRELTDIIALCRETGVGIATVNGDIDLSNDTGKMVATILGAVAEAEVERKGARQKSANAQRRSRGERWSSGWRPFGYELDGKLVPHEADLIREAANDVLNGTPLRAIARRWKESGVSTPRSDRGSDGWTHNGVRTILLNPRNAGLNTYEGKVVGRGNWTPIFNEEMHALLVARLNDPSRRTNNIQGRPPANLLSGIARCSICESPVTGGTIGRQTRVNGKRVSTGERVPVYKCPNEHLSTNREEADRLAIFAFQSAVMGLAPGEVFDIPERGVPSDLWDDAEALRTKLTELSDSFARGRISIEQLEFATESVSQQLEEVDARIAASASHVYDPQILTMQRLREFGDLNVSGKRSVFSTLAEITLHPKGRGRKNVPMTEQMTFSIRVKRNGRDYLVPILADADTKMRSWTP